MLGKPRLTLPALATLVASAAAAQVTSLVVPFAPHGDSICCVAGAPLELTATSVLVSTTGADGTETTADDVTLLIEDLDGTPTVTPLATPYLSDYSPRMARLSATRALVAHAGADGAFRSADDGVFLLDDLGGANAVTDVTTGALWTGDAFSPTRLGESVALLVTQGADGTSGTADDTVAILSDLGGTNAVTHLVLGTVFIGGVNRPVALDETSFLFASFGPDGSSNTADDEVVLVTDVGGANTQTPLATPYLRQYAGSVPAVLGPTRALVGTNGPDGGTFTADDVTFLLHDLDGTPAATPLATPYQMEDGGGGVAVLDADTALVVSAGPDGTQTTADDSVLLLDGLAGAPAVTPVTVGYLEDENAYLPARLGPDAAALATAGVDATENTADDEVAILSDLGGANAVARVAAPGLGKLIESRPVPLLPGFLVTHGGPDGALFSGAGDDVLSWVADPLGTPALQSLDVGEVNVGGKVFAAHPIGGGRAVLLDAGADLESQAGGDDGLRVVSGLEGGVSLVAQKLTVKFDAAKPQKGEKVSAKGELRLPEPDGFPQHALTVRVGNASQTLPAGSFVLKKNKWSYKDKKGLAGFLRKVTWHPEKGKLQVKGKGLATGAETTGADNVVLSLESAAFYAAVAHDGEAKKKQIVYKAPK